MAIMQGLHKDLHTKLGGLRSISKMDEKGESVNVRFNMEDGRANYGVQYRLIEAKEESAGRLVKIKEHTKEEKRGSVQGKGVV